MTPCGTVLFVSGGNKNPLCVTVRELATVLPAELWTLVLKSMFEETRKNNGLLDRVIRGETSCAKEVAPIVKKIKETGSLGKASKDLCALVRIGYYRGAILPDNCPDTKGMRDGAAETLWWANSLDNTIQQTYGLPPLKKVFLDEVLPTPQLSPLLLSTPAVVIIALVSAFIGWIVWLITENVGTGSISGALVFTVLSLKAIVTNANNVTWPKK